IADTAGAGPHRRHSPPCGWTIYRQRAAGLVRELGRTEPSVPAARLPNTRCRIDHRSGPVQPILEARPTLFVAVVVGENLILTLFVASSGHMLFGLPPVSAAADWLQVVV